MRSLQTRLILASLVLASSAIAAEKNGQPWRRFAGAGLRQVLTNAELGDDVHYSYKFHANGQFSGTEMARDVFGTWRTTPQGLCWRWIRPAGREECFEVERRDGELRGMRHGQEFWYGKVTPPPSR